MGVDIATLRAWWWHRQGLDGSLQGCSPAEVLERTGWARSVGGSNPYLTLFARTGVAREQVDSDLKALQIHELPSARGCTYVLPSVHFGLGLQLGRGAPEGEARVLEKLGVPRQELDRLCADVLKVLGDSKPLDPAKLKTRLGDAVRSLGEDGKRKGQSTTLPAALGLLQAAGEIRRVPVNGRIDQQRYAYVRWQPPASGLSDPQVRVELARLYLDWTGPASLAHFRWFSGFTVGDAKKAVAGFTLTETDGLLMPLHVAKELAKFTPPAKPQYALLAGIDALVLLRRDHHALLDSPQATVPGDKKSLGGQPDLPDHPIFDRGRLIGLWQYDPERADIAHWLFDGKKPDKALRDCVERTTAYIRDQLGDARSFSLDSPKSRAPRISALRSA